MTKPIPWHKKKVAYCAIKIISRYTGEEIFLGSKYSSYAEAEAAAKHDVCQRCNSYTIYPVERDSVWAGKHTPFTTREYASNVRRIKQERMLAERVLARPHPLAIRRQRRIDDGY